MCINKPTNKASRLAITNPMQQSNQAARVTDRLLEPHDLLVGPAAIVLVLGGVFVAPEFFVSVVNGKDEEEGVGRARHEGEQVRVVDAVHVVEAEGAGEPELVHEVRHHFRVVFWVVGGLLAGEGGGVVG